MKVFLLYFFISMLTTSCFSINYIIEAERCLAESRYDSASYYFTKQIDLLENTDKDLNLAIVLLKRGRSFELLNKFELTYKDYVHAQQLYIKQQNYNGLVITYTHLAELSRKNQNFDSANYYLDQANQYLNNKEVSNITLAKYFSRKASILNERGGSLEEVILYLKRVIQLAKKVNNLDLEATSLNELGFVYEKKGNSIYVDYYENAYDLFINNNDIPNALNVLINLSRYHVANQKYLLSLGYINKGLGLYAGQNYPTISIKLYYFQYQSIFHLGRFEEANITLENYTETHKKP
jgi:hypothetical protein